MAIHSVVLEAAFGNNAEGDVVQCNEELAQSLITAGIAREASDEDLKPGEEEEEGAEEGAEMVQDQVERVARSVESTLTKATEKAVEKLAGGSVKRPSFVHVAGSDEAVTGGFKNLGEFCQLSIAKKAGNYDAVRRMSRYEKVVHKGWSTKTPMSVSGSSGHVGGDLVPSYWAKEMWSLAFDRVPDLHGMCTQYPMESNVLNIPSWVKTAYNAGVLANVIAEANTITETQGVTATAQLSLVKFAVFVTLTDELERFNAYALDAVLKNVAPKSIRYLSNDSIVNGTNSQVNLVGNAATVVKTRTTNNRIEFADVLAMEAALFDDFGEDAVWLVNPSTLPELYSLAFPNRAATTPFPAFTPGNFGSEQLLGPKPLGILLGHPVYRLENVPALGAKGDIILYSPKSIAAGSTGLIADSTPFLYFDLAESSYRFMWYADTVNPMTSAYTRKDSSTASNIVVLSASS